MDKNFVIKLAVIHLERRGEIIVSFYSNQRLEERFAEYEIISGFTGIILTFVAIENNVRYTSFVTASYREILRKQKDSIA